MGVEIVVDGVVYAEIKGDRAPVRQGGVDRAMVESSLRLDLYARLENWRRVVAGSGGTSAAVCASWARWYVALRTSEAAPQQDVLEQKFTPPRPLVSNDVLDAWIVEEAWRKLPDFNDRMALKCKHVYGFDEARTRMKLKGVRGPHVRLVIARAENNLQTILKKLDNTNKIRPTTCLPGCPEPTAA